MFMLIPKTFPVKSLIYSEQQMISYTEAAAKHSFCSTNLPHVRTTCCLQLVYILLRTNFSEVRLTL
jgi:hypothetical protein